MTKKEIKGKLIALSGIALALAVDTKRQQDLLKTTVVRQLDLEVEIHKLNDLGTQLQALADEIEGDPVPADPADLGALADQVPGVPLLAQSPDPSGLTLLGTGNGEPLVGQNMGTVALGDPPLTGELPHTEAIGESDPPETGDDPAKEDDPPAVKAGSKKTAK